MYVAKRRNPVLAAAVLLAMVAALLPALVLSATPAHAIDDHALLCEAVVTPTADEFLEIANPTAVPIDLTNYYLSDDEDYALLPAGTQAIGSSDFIAQFPPGATLPAAGVVVVAFDGAGFASSFGSGADYEVRGTDAGTPNMIPTDVGATAGLTNSGENTVLFTWDGSSDLVTDVDMLNIGTPSSTNDIGDKTGLSVGASTYAPDAFTMPQQAGDPGFGASTKRVLLETGSEVTGGGNGITGDDETTEQITTTWDSPAFTAPNPGTCDAIGGGGPSITAGDLVVNEVDYDQPSSDSAEFVEIKNTTGSPIDLTGLDLVLVNGADALPYNTIALAGTLAAGDYFVVCGDAASVANCDLDSSPDTNFIQNGAPDAVAIEFGGTIIDTVSYEGNVGAPYTEGSGTGLDDNSGDGVAGISRCADGADTDQNNVDFLDARPITPGATNDCAVGGGLNPGDLVINEIMQNPAAVSDGNGEWFEVFNNTAGPVDLIGLTIRDDGSNTHTITSSVVVAVGDFAVLARNSTFATNGGVTVDYQYSSFFLGNSDDEVIIEEGGVEIDRVEYDGGPSFPDPTGAAMALDVTTNDNNDGSNWCTASTPYGDGDLGTPGAANDCPIPPDLGSCGDGLATLIHTIQGSDAASSPDAGQFRVIEGVVVGDFQGSTGLNGFFVQEEDADADGDSLSSEGIFVFDGAFGVDVDNGDVVRVRGLVAEFFGLTEITSVLDVVDCGTTGTASAASVTFPVSAVDDLEDTEGMLVNIPQTLHVSGNFNQGRFGEVDLSVGGPLDNPTNIVAPGVPALAQADLNNRSRIQLDDGSNVQNPVPLPPYIGAGNTLRTGDTVSSLTAVLGFSFGAYELHPQDSSAVSFTRVNVRPSAPPAVGGSLTVAAYNVLNYFLTLDTGPDICGPSGTLGCRGADNAVELAQQRAKLVAALSKLDADIVGLIELENPLDDAPIADLVAGVNAVVGPGTYNYIATGDIGTDAIRVGLIYKPAKVTPVGPFAILDSSVDPNFMDTKNRPVLAQTFSENGTDDVVTVAVNHLKSKGSPCDDVGDPNAGDGQGNCNGTRDKAAQALVTWLATDPTGSGSTEFLITGDLNAYAQEDPVNTIEAGGYTDNIEAFLGTGYPAGAYSFNFNSESGSLDHALTSASLTPRVTGADHWHVNADEPRALDYNDFNQAALFVADEFRSSDHDPILLGICETTPPVVDVTASPDSLWPPNHKYKDVTTTVVVTDADPNATITLVSVTSNEPDNGVDDGNTINDIVIVDDFNFQLRAERSGVGTGRVYTITYEVTDACGNTSVASATVTAPLSQGS